MSTPLIVTQLREKQAEIEASIKSLEARISEARSDLAHVAGTIRLFDPTASERPARAYHSATKGLKRSDLFDRCKAALEASAEPLDTRQLAEHVITVQGWDTDDRCLRLAMAHKVGTMMARFELRGTVQKVGERDRATLWRMG